jgi:hypothetical protein
VFYGFRDYVGAAMPKDTQRELMLRLFRELRGNPERTIQAYADAERLGKVSRASNKHDIGSEAYARGLFADGVRKGWLRL